MGGNAPAPPTFSAARIISYARGDIGVRWYTGFGFATESGRRFSPASFAAVVVRPAISDAPDGREALDAPELKAWYRRHPCVRSPQGTTQRRHCWCSGDRRNWHRKVQFFLLLPSLWVLIIAIGDSVLCKSLIYVVQHVDILCKIWRFSILVSSSIWLLSLLSLPIYCIWK
jgi:hypothetical protein